MTFPSISPLWGCHDCPVTFTELAPAQRHGHETGHRRLDWIAQGKETMPPTPAGRKLMDLAELRDVGYLQELNRQFLHPLGLALAVNRAEDGTLTVAGVWDDRDDPEGIYFGDVDQDFVDKADRVADLYWQRTPPRTRALGYMVQPVPHRGEIPE